MIEGGQYRERTTSLRKSVQETGVYREGIMPRLSGLFRPYVGGSKSINAVTAER